MLIRKLHLLSGALLGILLGFAFFAISAAAQTTAPDEWTWVSGNGAGSSNPINRLGSSSWTDHNGNLWLYGGYYYTANQSCTCVTADLDDLWMFAPSTNQWTFVSGISNSGLNTPGSYGTLGTPAPSNTPGGRDSAVSWTDSSGNLWLFGGSYTSTGYFLNDLWEFNPSTQDWVWMGGSQTPTGANLGASGVYGTLGTPNAANVPGGRKRALSWTDSNGKFWLYGGYGIDSTGTWGDLNDLWKFDPSLGTYGEWTWMGGSNTLPGSNDSLPPVYGTLGSPAAANNPGGLEYASGWADKNGNLWLFGGEASDNTNDTQNWYNDLWKFDPSLGTYGEWAWMSGSSSTSYQPGVYGTLGTPATGNVPGGRLYASSWIDNNGNLWLFGGEGESATGWAGWFNDLWVFDPSNSLWAWMGGVSGIGSNKWLSPSGYIYGQPGFPNPRMIRERGRPRQPGPTIAAISGSSVAKVSMAMVIFPFSTTCGSIRPL
jgi:N-acetylneuraminic acid mutarotase